MNLYYDSEVDALYIKMSDKKPDGVVEIQEGVNIDSTADGKIVGIEILNTSQKLDIHTILSYNVSFNSKAAALLAI